jgi:hypothetical protein
LIGVLAVIGAIGAGLFFVGGFYDVAGTTGHPAIVHWALVQVRRRRSGMSIRHHAVAAPPTGFDSPAKIQAGARAFALR